MTGNTRPQVHHNLTDIAWLNRMAKLEDGCDVCAGGGDIDDLIFHQEPEHEEEEK